MKKIQLKDLADKLGISVSQVSRALNQRGSVAPEIRSRVVELARKMNYRNFSWRHTRKIAIIIERFADFDNNILNETLRICKKLSWQIVVIPRQNIELLNDQLYDGAIVISCAEVAPGWHEKYNMPLVVINNFGSALDRICSVFPDADGEVRIAMEHLIALGHTRIARIRGGAPDASEQNLQRGLGEFYRIAEACGIRDTVFNACYAGNEEKIAAVCELIAKGFTAFLVVMDDDIPSLLDAIRKCGKRIPEDISVITYESHSISAFQDPPLTTLEYDYKRLTALALQQLGNEMDNGEVASQIVVPVRINIRSSTGPCNRCVTG